MDHAASIRRLYDLVNTGHTEGFGSFLADNFVEHEETPGFPATRAGTIEYFKLLFAAFPDLKMHVDDVIASGDKAVARVRVTGTHKGEFMGIAPTGRTFEMKLIDIVRFDADGRPAEHWGVSDVLSLMQQLGAIPAGPPA